jgi:hypothetical protein
VRDYFNTYGENSALSVGSAGGTVSITPASSDIDFGFLGLTDRQSPQYIKSFLPPSLSVHAFGGDIVLGGQVTTMAPSDAGQLTLFAAHDLRQDSLSFGLVMSDASDADAASVDNPARGAPDVSLLQNDTIGTGRHAGDPHPAVVVAGHDIETLFLKIPKSGSITAGHNIHDLLFEGQNLNPTDATFVEAGGDIVEDDTATRISVGGPGRLDVVSAGNVDLGFSNGIVTVGRLLNPALPDTGADLTVIAGLGQPMDAAGFLDKVVAQSTDLQEQLISYTTTLLTSRGHAPAKPLSYQSAAAIFKALPADDQRPLLTESFFTELVTSGREANNIDPVTGKSLGFGRGYQAIDALFPQSRSTDSPYAGDLSLAFSRIYTLSGGNISLLVPGGLVDVGLANPPPTVTAKQPSELGIVAQGTGNVDIYSMSDVLVNQSRVFTLGGGDIAIWSTVGNIDAGRGAKSSISAPPPAVLVTPDGIVTLDFSGAVAGSGIRTIDTGKSTHLGDVDLYAPVGFVEAGDAGIGSAGNITVAAVAVLGAENIQVGGKSSGVPAETSGLGASVAGAASAGSSTTNAASDATREATESKQSAAPLAQATMSWLDVFVVGFGEEACQASDEECLKRQKQKQQE